MFFGILFNAFTALGEISQLYSQRPIIVLPLQVTRLMYSKNINLKLYITLRQMHLHHFLQKYLLNCCLPPFSISCSIL